MCIAKATSRASCRDRWGKGAREGPSRAPGQPHRAAERLAVGKGEIPSEPRASPPCPQRPPATIPSQRPAGDGRGRESEAGGIWGRLRGLGRCVGTHMHTHAPVWTTHLCTRVSQGTHHTQHAHMCTSVSAVCAYTQPYARSSATSHPNPLKPKFLTNRSRGWRCWGVGAGRA